MVQMWQRGQVPLPRFFMDRLQLMKNLDRAERPIAAPLSV